MASVKQIKSGIQQSNTIVHREVLQENGEPYLGPDGATPCTFGIVGKDSEHYKAEVKKFSRAVQQMPRAERKAVDWRRGLAACGIPEWTGWTDADDVTPWPCAREHVLALLAADHILEQAEAMIEGHASFFPKPSTT